MTDIWILKPSDYPGETHNSADLSNMPASERHETAAQIIVVHPDGRHRWLKDRSPFGRQGKGWLEPDKPDNRRTKAKAATRQKVLDAATALFAAEGGYQAATIRSIAEAAGMSTGAVFASFTDKVALYTAIYGHPPVTPEKGVLLLRIVRNLLSSEPRPLDAKHLLETMGFFPREPEA